MPCAGSCAVPGLGCVPWGRAGRTVARAPTSAALWSVVRVEQSDLELSLPVSSPVVSASCF